MNVRVGCCGAPNGWMGDIAMMDVVFPVICGVLYGTTHIYILCQQHKGLVGWKEEEELGGRLHGKE